MAGPSSIRAYWGLGQALLVLLLLALAGPARASEPVRLEERCRIAAPADAALPVILKALERCDRPAAKGHHGTIWIEYSRLPVWVEPIKTWRLALDNHRVRAVDLWLVFKQGPARHIAYDPNAPDREWLAGNYFSILFTPGREVERVVVRFEDSQSHSYIRAPLLARAKAFASIERNQAALYGMGVGMLALTILFHLSLFFAMRRRFQLIYCLHVGMLLAYGLCYSGIVRMVVPGLGATGISQMLGFTMAGATATGIAFISEFLGGAMPRWIRRWALSAAAASLAAAIVVVIVPAAWSDAAYLVTNVIALHAILLTTAILITACVRGHPMAGAIAAGWVLPILVSLMYPARTFGLITPEMLPDGLMMLATIAECLILSLPVASRIRTLRIDHERAQERHVVLERQAQTDSLTGLANRRGFGEALIRAEAGHAEPMPTALMLIDIDHFKRVNDRYGHAAGDAILRHVAAHVARVAGPGAIVARHGGEEFVVALRGYDLMRAGTVAERIRNSIGITFDTETNLPRVTVSIGVAAGFSDEIEMVLEDADCALYRAKDQGRNQVMLADGPIVYAVAA